MQKMYEAILTDNKIERVNDSPILDYPGQRVRVSVTILDEVSELAEEERRRRMVEALSNLAKNNAFAGIDPVEWQREIRKDRPLPGRED